MKKFLSLLILLSLTFSIIACDKEVIELTQQVTYNSTGRGEQQLPSTDDDNTFIATVTSINSTTAVVMPAIGELERNSASKISFSFEGRDISAKIGDTVKIFYDGMIMETYPAQIIITGWEITTALKDTSFTKLWIDKDGLTPDKSAQTEIFKITEIYANCFFASERDSETDIIKLNGEIGEDFCIGDLIKITYENTYTDEKNGRREANIKSINAPLTDAKPVIYLYPETPTEVSVKLTPDGAISCTYPEYNGGWTVVASPDGTLTDASGQTYSYLYWESQTFAKWDMSRGFCVKGEDTACFLEDALARLGLNRREANEFIVYWLPLMQNNEYNIICFQSDIYTESARLDISPAPDTLIRVFMAFCASDTYAELEAQTLSAPERVGFTVVEWGGCKIS